MRNWLNIINEFQRATRDNSVFTDRGQMPPLPPEKDDDDGGRRNGLVIVTDILWDTDDESLPTRVTIPIEDLDDISYPSSGGGPDGDMMTRIGDWLSNHINPSVSNFDYNVI